MKRNHLSSALLIGAIIFAGCNGGSTDTTTTSTDSSSTNMASGETTVSTDTGMNSGMTNNTAVSATPLAGLDKTFAMNAAKGGMMEVEAGRIAQENSNNERVKAFGAMMVRDHTMANDELKGIVTGKGMMVPEDSLMTLHKSHLDAMRKLKGSAFDKHYVNMMLKDHDKDISQFEKASNSATDPAIKAFATKNLPTLKMHKDSAQALSKMKL
jgi:putative membrane protein